MPQDSEQGEPGRVYHVERVTVALSRFQARQLLLVRRRLQEYAESGQFTTPAEMYKLATILWEALPYTHRTLNAIESTSDSPEGNVHYGQNED